MKDRPALEASRLPASVLTWFGSRGWTPFSFQEQTWQAYLKGQGGLIHAATGTGKTLAAWIGPVLEWMDEVPTTEGLVPHPGRSRRAVLADPGTEARSGAPGLRVLWVTPLRALAQDTLVSLRRPIEEMGVPWTVEKRTGDTPSAKKQRQRHQLPTALVTTPESLSLLLSYHGMMEQMRGLRAVVVDEWHELLGSKRGVQTELALARLRRWAPGLRVWGLSATIGNLEEAACALHGSDAVATAEGVEGKMAPGLPLLIQGQVPKPVTIDALLPEEVERFPWAGHLGVNILDQVLAELDQAKSALIFTNTRSQCEAWYRALLEARPLWAGSIALHHGSLDRQTRRWVEEQLAAGKLRCVVCTSSLDLGVDFTPVERVFQVGSPKGVARLMQRAGRSGHQPGVESRATGIPTHALELLEYAAARDAVARGYIEHRIPVQCPLDVLVQHVITVALGTGFDPDELYDEVQTTHAYRHLSREDWDWVLSFAATGGPTLAAYPEYHRLAPVAGQMFVTTTDVAKRHRMSIGTIVSDPMMTVRLERGRTLGTIEESFISRLKPGDTFIFAGRALELRRVQHMRAYVRRAATNKGAIPRWAGGRMALSSQLSSALRRTLDEVARDVHQSPEVETLAPILTLQRRWSAIPEEDELLIERTESRDGHHLFLFPLEGRLVHEGLAPLLALRLSRLQPITFTVSANDFGLELLSPEPAPLEQGLRGDLFSTDHLAEDIRESINQAELARRQFREIARVAGLVFSGYPGRGKSTSQLQASSSLIFDVFSRFDPENKLLVQAEREMMEGDLEEQRLRGTLERMSTCRVRVVDTPRISPFAFPIYVDRMREGTLSSERFESRIRKMQVSLEKAAGGR